DGVGVVAVVRLAVGDEQDVLVALDGVGPKDLRGLVEREAGAGVDLSGVGLLERVIQVRDRVVVIEVGRDRGQVRAHAVEGGVGAKTDADLCLDVREHFERARPQRLPGVGLGHGEVLEHAPRAIMNTVGIFGSHSIANCWQPASGFGAEASLRPGPLPPVGRGMAPVPPVGTMVPAEGPKAPSVTTGGQSAHRHAATAPISAAATAGAARSCAGITGNIPMSSNMGAERGPSRWSHDVRLPPRGRSPRCDAAPPRFAGANPRTLRRPSRGPTRPSLTISTWNALLWQ